MLKNQRLISFDWDKSNINKNWQRHQVDFKEAEEVFFNQPSEFYPDPKHSKNETRFYTLGTNNQGRKLAIFFTIRNKKIRIISARDMSRRERKLYEKNS